MRTFATELPVTPLYAQRRKGGALSLLYRKGKKGRAASPERQIVLFIINLKNKQT